MIIALVDKAARAGIVVEVVDERGTSSTCPRCGKRVAKPKGRTFQCPTCTLVAHRDLVGAANIAPRGSRGGARRAGRHRPGRTRRDPRRVSMDKRRARVGPWPAVARPEEIGASLVQVASVSCTRNCQPETEQGKGLSFQH
jgi:putative transposase